MSRGKGEVPGAPGWGCAGLPATTGMKETLGRHTGERARVHGSVHGSERNGSARAKINANQGAPRVPLRSRSDLADGSVLAEDVIHLLGRDVEGQVSHEQDPARAVHQTTTRSPRVPHVATCPSHRSPGQTPRPPPHLFTSGGSRCVRALAAAAAMVTPPSRASPVHRPLSLSAAQVIGPITLAIAPSLLGRRPVVEVETGTDSRTTVGWVLDRPSQVWRLEPPSLGFQLAHERRGAAICNGALVAEPGA